MTDKQKAPLEFDSYELERTAKALKEIDIGAGVFSGTMEVSGVRWRVRWDDERGGHVVVISR